MNENQRKLLKRIQWFTIPFAMLVVGFSVWPYLTSGNQEETLERSQQFFKMTELLTIVPLIFFVFVFYALGREFFKKQSGTDSVHSLDEVLIYIEPPHHKIAKAIVFLIVIGIAVFLNILLFSPETIWEFEQQQEFTFIEKSIFIFFYTVCHFLVIVFGSQLFKKKYLFIATEKGFQYSAGGISTGLVLWEDIEEIRESSVLSGNNIGGPVSVPVLGIKLRSPEKYVTNYNPALQKLVLIGAKFNNFQTDGVGDLLLNPADFGRKYAEVKALMESKKEQYKK